MFSLLTSLHLRCRFDLRLVALTRVVVFFLPVQKHQIYTGKTGKYIYLHMESDALSHKRWQWRIDLWSPVSGEWSVSLCWCWFATFCVFLTSECRPCTRNTGRRTTVREVSTHSDDGPPALFHNLVRGYAAPSPAKFCRIFILLISFIVISHRLSADVLQLIVNSIVNRNKNQLLVYSCCAFMHWTIFVYGLWSTLDGAVSWLWFNMTCDCPSINCW